METACVRTEGQVKGKSNSKDIKNLLNSGTMTQGNQQITG